MTGLAVQTGFRVTYQTASGGRPPVTAAVAALAQWTRRARLLVPTHRARLLVPPRA
ncbi:hypothetical protein ACIQ8D_36170 [Streptomyces sp. NPDC096094]|uniref:hypothetical protein n=1 Tax=Streptomyces sp. NPDC096094 TaxID=3366073 RepID=UPI00382A266E